MGFFDVFSNIIIAAVLGGASAGLLGIFITGLRMPFLGVCTAHSAMAGAIFGDLLGLNPSISGFFGAIIGALLLSFIIEKKNIDINAAIGSIFSFMLGIAFLGIGLNRGARSSVLGLMWGSLLFISKNQIYVMAFVLLLFIGFILYFYKELKILLFSRDIAFTLINDSYLFLILLIFKAGIIAINLEIVGGMMLYSLISNPAIIALRLSRSYNASLFWSSLLGSISAVGGFFIAYWFDLPLGACIVLFSSMLVAVLIYGQPLYRKFFFWKKLRATF